MNFQCLRNQSEVIARSLGYTINQHLPLLSGVVLQKTVEDVAARMLALNCVVATAHGFPKGKALKWLERQGLKEQLSPRERLFLEESKLDSRDFMMQVEGLWAFAWVVNKVEELRFNELCGNNLVTLLPDMLKDEPADIWSQMLTLRDEREIIEACDLLYVLHWSIQDAFLRRTKLPGKIPAYAVIERRRALEWLIQAEEWDAVVLDT